MRTTTPFESKEQAAQAMGAAIRAYHEEMARCKRDPNVWKEQAVESLSGLLKFVCFGLLMMIIAGLLDAPLLVGFLVAMVIAPPVVMINPKVLGRNVFDERAGKAFDAEIQRHIAKKLRVSGFECVSGH